MLRGRRSECALLDAMVAAVRGGESRTLVVRGEAGVGKSALLDYAVESASELRVVRAAGVESEMELAFAAAHQLCAPLLDRLGRIPVPQRNALRIVFGLSSGPPPDQFLVGLAVLSLLSEVAAERPLLCVVDDAQWLDRASARTLGVCRPGGCGWSRSGCCSLRASRATTFEGCPSSMSRGFVVVMRVPCWGRSSAVGSMSGVRDRILAETRGNPLALLELPRGLSATQLAGGFGLLGRAGAAGADRGQLPAAARGTSRARPAPCCWSPRPSRSATRCWCGVRPSGSASGSPRRSRPRRKVLLAIRDARDASVIRWCARPSTDPRRRSSAGRCTWRWQR